MKAISVCALLLLLSIVAYGRISAAPSGAGEPRSETRTSLPADLPTYLFLHKTWNENTAAPTAARLSVCPE